MFNNEMEIYQHIGQAMFNALPDEDEWDSAIFYMTIRSINPRACIYEMTYLVGDAKYDFNVDNIDDEYEDSGCTDAFYALYNLMKKDEADIPWNKARFELMPDGTFDIQFKYDEDFAWYLNLDLDKKKDSKLHKNLSSSDLDLIESWEGLPEDFDRYWLK